MRSSVSRVRRAVEQSTSSGSRPLLAHVSADRVRRSTPASRERTLVVGRAGLPARLPVAQQVEEPHPRAARSAMLAVWRSGSATGRVACAIRSTCARYASSDRESATRSSRRSGCSCSIVTRCAGTSGWVMAMDSSASCSQATARASAGARHWPDVLQERGAVLLVVAGVQPLGDRVRTISPHRERHPAWTGPRAPVSHPRETSSSSPPNCRLSECSTTRPSMRGARRVCVPEAD